jgi:hypothetical protein
LLGRAYNRRKAIGFKGNQYTESGGCQNDTKQNTAEIIAEEHGVSERTVKRAGKIAETLDDPTQTTEELLSCVNAALISPSDAAKLTKMDKDDQTALVAKVKSGETVSKAVQAIKKDKAIESLTNISAKKSKEILVVYDVIVIDPLWRMAKSRGYIIDTGNVGKAINLIKESWLFALCLLQQFFFQMLFIF